MKLQDLPFCAGVPGSNAIVQPHTRRCQNSYGAAIQPLPIRTHLSTPESLSSACKERDSGAIPKRFGRRNCTPEDAETPLSDTNKCQQDGGHKNDSAAGTEARRKEKTRLERRQPKHHHNGFHKQYRSVEAPPAPRPARNWHANHPAPQSPLPHPASTLKSAARGSRRFWWTTR